MYDCIDMMQFLLFHMLIVKGRILILHPCMQLAPTMYESLLQVDVSFVVMGSDNVCPILLE